ncbi:helix-turn-helix transcriptional regulator [Paenibacillus phocaensis]|uniref:helix-turn-helix transcriptional regulator n=1 Tax=Paenibacillus phocaensis TaxID=1776378 RepID=UPI0003A0E50E|nr:helix-turn-helix transcriptional regulator [Paenibacillus phocaensis]
MDRYLLIGSVVVFVENRLQSHLSYAELEQATGFSLAHIRDVFAKHTGKSLSRYILGRRIANAAFELIHSQTGILEIALKYGFSNHDTFTRAFKRITGLTPQEFRKRRCPVGRIKLCAGVYGIGILNQKDGKDD